ncbi:hypothetical protein EJ02DRAFT_514551 [Clathrospora elynae]|uniref:Uncharacterized protein n=1 Tax=Clathrospora elynae TaxID=706981 RepID=A0A6A5SCP6_9PLEO|nr:hypothetical protein EJ02DRAFT_514551 [Clathrospora elynae]
MMLIDRTLTMDAEQSTASATATTSTTGVPTLAKTTVSPSAKSTVDSILLELGRKGLRKAAANLPHHSTIRIEPQTDHSDAEHLFRLCIGTLSSGEEVWIYVGSKPKDRSNASNLAPTIKVYASHNGVETRAVHSSAWHEIRMIEPFKELWKRTSDSARKENKSWMDQRRGMFKSLVFWYFANEGAARGERLRFPEFMRSHYLVLALRKLGEVAPALRSENLSGMGSDGVDGIAAMLGGLSQHERQQKDIEARIREEGKKKKELAADTKALEDLEKEKEAAMRQRRIDTLRIYHRRKRHYALPQFVG